MIYLHWIVVLIFWLYVIAIIATSAVVVMENRQPVKTMAWLLVLILLPVVGLVLFIFFGQDIKPEDQDDYPMQVNHGCGGFFSFFCIYASSLMA